MNGIYSEAALDVPFGDGGFGAESAGPQHYADIRHNSDQRTTLDGLAKYADMANRLDRLVTAYEDYADAIEVAHGKLSDVADDEDMTIAGVPGWWREEIQNQRAWRKALVESVRMTANRVATTYGIR